MSDIDNEYQEAKIVFVFWRLAIQKATDGSGALWVTVRLKNGDPKKRKLTNIKGE